MLCYISSYSDEPSGLMTTFSIILIIWGILNIILFFKLWGACNDIKKLLPNKDLGWQQLYLIGKKEEAAQAIIMKLVDDLNSMFEFELQRIENNMGARYQPVTTDFEPSYYAHLVEKADKLLSQIGADLPIEVATPEAYIGWRLSLLKIN